jgi:hypothetical protein
MPTIVEKLGPTFTPQERSALADNLRKTVVTGIAAFGSVQSQAISSIYDVVAITSTHSAVNDAFMLRDPSDSKGYELDQFVINRAGAQVRVFCPTGGSLNGTTNGSVALASAAHGHFICTDRTNKTYVKL